MSRGKQGYVVNDRRGNKKGAVVGSNIKRMHDAEWLDGFARWQKENYGDIRTLNHGSGKYYARMAVYMKLHHEQFI